MKRKFSSFFQKSSKKSFLLIEVIIAITILMIGTVGGFEMYSVMYKKTQKLDKITSKLLFSEQALCQLLELLYTQKIPFEDIAGNKAFSCKLDETWNAQFQFSSIENRDDEDLPKNIVVRKVQITLVNTESDEKNIELQPAFPLCVKKE